MGGQVAEDYEELAGAMVLAEGKKGVSLLSEELLKCSKALGGARVAAGFVGEFQKQHSAHEVRLSR